MVARSALSFILLLGAIPLAAQQLPEADSTIPRSSGHSWGLLGGLAAGAVALAVAPAGALLLPGVVSPDPNLRLADHETLVYASGGIATRSSVDGWTHSQTFEHTRSHLHVAARLESFPFADDIQFQTLRIGYLARPSPAARGGVTLGYRHTNGRRSADAFEIGIPLTIGGERGAFRFVPAYLASSRGVTWSYRLQAEFYMPKPLVTGILFEAKPFSQGGPYRAMISLIAGIRR